MGEDMTRLISPTRNGNARSSYVVAATRYEKTRATKGQAERSFRAVHVVPAIAEEASGPSYSVPRLCESLIERGIDVTLATLAWPGTRGDLQYLKTFPMSVPLKRLGASSAMHHWLEDTATSDESLIIQSHGMWQLNSLYPGWVARKHQCKLIVSPRGAFSPWAMANGSRFKKMFWALLQRPALRPVVLFHATAESEYEDIRRLGFKQPVAVIPNGIDVPSWSVESRIKASRRTVLFLGRLHVTKGLDLLLPAWVALEKAFPNWGLVIVGESAGYARETEYVEEMRLLASTLGAKRVKFAGAKIGEQKWQAYADADLFVLPTRSENFGIAVAEALAMGVPAIVTRGAPWAGLVDRKAGWWTDISVEALRVALTEAMSMAPETLSTMGERGAQWMQQEFAWPRIGERMAATYAWLAGCKQERPEWVRID